MAWFYILGATAGELIFIALLKRGISHREPLSVVLFLVSLALTAGFLVLAMEQLPIAIAYPVWVSLGTAGSVLMGKFFFAETVTAAQWSLILLMLSGVVVLALWGYR